MFEHRRHIAVLATAGVTFGQAALSGGGARSAHWPQIFADGLGVPVTVADCQETGALGAAIAAAVGARLHADVPAAVKAMTRPARTYTPDASMRAYYNRRYEIWTSLTEAVDPLWRRLAAQDIAA